MSYKRNIILLASLFTLASCGPSTESSSSSSETKGQYDLKGQLNKLKATKTLELTLQYDLKDGTNNRGNIYTYSYSPNFFALTKDEVTAGISNGEGGIWDFQIANNEFIAGPIRNLNIKSVWESETIRNYFDGLNPSRVGESDVFTFSLSDSVNLGAILRMGGLSPTSGLLSIVQEAKVEAKENGLVFSVDFGVNGTIVETITHIDDASYSLPLYKKYLDEGGKPRQAEDSLVSLMGLFSSCNYSSSMGEIQNGDDTIKVGTRYFTSTYVYEDYTDEYITYAKSRGSEVKRQGYIEIQDNENVANGIYSFEVNHYDGSNQPLLRDSDLTQAYANAKLIDEYPFFQTLTFSKYLSSFYSGYQEPFYGKEAYRSTRSDLATEFSQYIFGVKETANAMYIVDSGTKENPSVTFYTSYSNGQGYQVNVTGFGKTSISFLEEYLTK